MVVSRPIMMTIGRHPTCALILSPAARAACILACVSRHNSGALLTCSNSNDNGRPDNSVAMRRISNSPGPKSELTSSTPRPARFIARARPRSSASPADRLGVLRPSRVRCFVVLEVVNPRAPARKACSSSSPMRSISFSSGMIVWSAPRSPMT